MNSALIEYSHEQRMLVGAVGDIARKYGHRYFADRGRGNQKIEELWQELGAAGFLGVNIAERYGGGGGGVFELALVLEELAANGIPLFIGVISPGICGSVLQAHGSDAQKAEWLPDIASGQRIMAFAITESNAGSNSHKLSTTARRDADRWVISGSKTFISGADQADGILVVARSGVDESTGRAQLSLFIVPADTPGIRMDPIAMELVSPDRQFTVFLDDVAVDSAALVGTEGEGLRQVFAGLNPERITVAALSNGIGRYGISRACEYARQRQVWEAPIGTHQGLAHPLAENHIKVELARSATMRAATLYDTGKDASEAANMAKFAAAEAALGALDQAIQTLGGNGLTSEYGLADLWFIARLMRIAPVSREMVLNFIAQHSLSLPRSF